MDLTHMGRGGGKYNAADGADRSIIPAGSIAGSLRPPLANANMQMASCQFG
jgi:hypothetical protein